MKNIVLIFCLLVTVLARPEPEPEPGYSFSNGLQHHQNDIVGHSSNGLTSHLYTSSGNVGAQILYDTGILNQISGPSGFASGPQHAQVYTIQPSQSYDLTSVIHSQHQHQHQHQPEQIHHQPQTDQHHSYLQEQNTAFIGHRTYGIQAEEQHIEGDIGQTSGEGIIEPRLNNDGPQASSSYQNSYIPPPQQSSYIPPPSPPTQNSYIPPPPPPPPQPAPQSSYIPSPPSPQSQTTHIEAPTQNNYLSAPSSYQPSGYSSSDGYYPAAKQVVHKHVYVHVPPKDFDDEPHPRQHFQIPQAQKHYKIIFIKAPTQPTYPPPVIPPIPQNEEKTLIYVLHKKPEEPEDIVIPTAIPTQPSKPEVYFIKYKTRKETLAGLYGAPASAPADSASAAGYGESLSSGQTTTGHIIENETNLPPTESDHNSHDALISTSTIHSTGSLSSSSSSSAKSSLQSSSYGPPHKSH